MNPLLGNGNVRILVHLTVLNFFLKILGSAEGLRDVLLETPSYVRLGEEITLRCSYDLEKGTLYAVNWYRGLDEFYRYVPRMLRPKQVFSKPLRPGINVDFVKSDEHHVVLRNASFDTSGKYKCSVSVEGNFETISDTRDITVVSIGYDAPILMLKDLHYEPGSQGEAVCRIHKTSPPVNLSWYINDKRAWDRVITRVETDDHDPRISSTISVIYFTLPNKRRTTEIKCWVQLFDLYSEKSSTRITPRVPMNTRNADEPDSLVHATTNDAEGLGKTLFCWIIAFSICAHGI